MKVTIQLDQLSLLHKELTSPNLNVGLAYQFANFKLSFEEAFMMADEPYNQFQVDYDDWEIGTVVIPQSGFNEEDTMELLLNKLVGFMKQ